MVTIAGGILLAIAILAIGFLMVMLFVSGIITELAWALTKWLAKLALSLAAIPLFIWTNQSGSTALATLGACTAVGLLCYLDYLNDQN